MGKNGKKWKKLKKNGKKWGKNGKMKKNGKKWEKMEKERQKKSYIFPNILEKHASILIFNKLELGLCNEIDWIPIRIHFFES